MFLTVTVTNSCMQEDIPQRSDGRARRWDAHRETRRAQFVDAACAAIAAHGAGVDMDQVARYAGVSKTVLYRYFSDKAQLFAAAGDRVAETLLDAVVPAVARVREERALVAAAIDAYLGAIEAQPQLYAFVMGRGDQPGQHALVMRSSSAIAAGLARVIGDRLRALGLDAGPAEPWAYGLVGMVQSVGDWWMSHERPMSRAALTDYLTTLLWEGIRGVRASADLPAHLTGLREAMA